MDVGLKSDLQIGRAPTRTPATPCRSDFSPTPSQRNTHADQPGAPKGKRAAKATRHANRPIPSRRTPFRRHRPDHAPHVGLKSDLQIGRAPTRTPATPCRSDFSPTNPAWDYRLRNAPQRQGARTCASRREATVAARTKPIRDSSKKQKGSPQAAFLHR